MNKVEQWAQGQKGLQYNGKANITGGKFKPASVLKMSENRETINHSVLWIQERREGNKSCAVFWAMKVTIIDKFTGSPSDICCNFAQFKWIICCCMYLKLLFSYYEFQDYCKFYFVYPCLQRILPKDDLLKW